MKEKKLIAQSTLQNLLQVGDHERVIALFEALQQERNLQEARLQALLDTMNEAVCMVDENDQVVAWNEQAVLLYGIDQADIVGKAVTQFFSNLIVSKVVQEGEHVKDAYHRPRSDKHVLINARAIQLDDRIIGGVGCERDITELVQLNQKLSQSHEEVRSLKQEIHKIHQKSDAFATVYGHSEPIKEAIAIAKRVAAASVPVMLRGESGTGKELFAKAIHEASGRQGQFVAINCGAIPANLFESELFGYESGAFTGADRKGKAGFLEQSDGGTLLLDELGDMPKEMQVKLLRALQDKTFYRVGGQKPIEVNVRLIAATNRNLEEMIQTGQFRQDLYYRLNVVSVHLPPLRDRKEDIPELIQRGLAYFRSLHHKKIERLAPSLLAVLLEYSWPGNIRELFNVLERLVILADQVILDETNLPESIFSVCTEANQSPAVLLAAACEKNLTTATEALERDAIDRALQAESYNKANTAKRLGIPRSTLYYKLRKLHIECQ
ncbi:MAG: sigma 54-interacting transcriptional regulator [Sporomusaceae bacterium]|nr:sigma 54-interacting transcriptional regulator [Sporomusaceae bacterium]